MEAALRDERGAERRKPSRRELICVVLVVGAIALGFGLIVYSYWPGVMIDDARWQYQQAVDNAYEDWHPPLMAWVWRRLVFIQPGPAPMLILQLSLYWIGFALIAAWVYRRDPRLGVAAACSGWLPAPLALTGAVTKDCLMAGALACACGLLLWAKLATSRWSSILLSATALTALLFAAALRFNAFLACVPLAIALAPKSLTRTRLRAMLIGASATVIFIGIGPAISAAVQAENMGASHSLILFDLGGIAEYSGISVFPEKGVSDPVAANHQCYDPRQWDGYSSWAKQPCPLGFDRLQSLIDDDDVNPNAIWIEAIVRHPVAYAQHRLAHFNWSVSFLTGGPPQPPAWTASAPNPWHYQVRPNEILNAVNTYAELAARTPFGWPFFWISVAVACVTLGATKGLPREVVAIPASAALYGVGYLPFGVATGMRYHLWTIMGAAIGLVLVASEIWHAKLRVRRRDLIATSAMIALPTALAIGWRLGS